MLFEPLVSTRAENAKAVRQVHSSAGLASDLDAPAHWIEAGRAFERSGLQATVLEVHKAHLNQPLHVPGLRSELSPLLGLKEGRPDLLIGLGIEDLTVVQTAVGRRANEGGVAVSGLAPASIPRRIPRRSRPTAHTAGSR